MLTAVEGGHQAALMAPTEVLADQHAQDPPTRVNRALARIRTALVPPLPDVARIRIDLRQRRMP